MGGLRRLQMKLLGTDHYIWLALPAFLIILAEALIFMGHMKAAMIVHALNLIILVLLALYIDNRILMILLLLPLFRLLNAAMPVFFELTLYTYPLVYAPMFIPMYLILKEGILSRSEAGITCKDFLFYLPLAVSIGFALGWGEYGVLKPGILLPEVDIQSVLILSITMILFVGLIEEFIFRSALQTVLQERFGVPVGLIAASLIFGFMHGGYHLPLEIIYVCFAGIVFGLLFWTSKSLPVASLSHGITNIALFLVVPLKPDVIVYLIGLPGMLFLCMFLYRKFSRKSKANNWNTE
jgi:membrane protease YdiL (CAAX protease family)